MLQAVRKLEDVLLVGLLRASFDKSCVLMSMHAWLDVLFCDNILAGRQRLYLILLCVPMCSVQSLCLTVTCLLEQNSMGVVCIYLYCL